MQENPGSPTGFGPYSVVMRGYDPAEVDAFIDVVTAARNSGQPLTMPVPAFKIVLRGYNSAQVDAEFARLGGSPPAGTTGGQSAVTEPKPGLLRRLFGS